MKKKSLLLILLAVLMAMAITGCSAVIKDDEGGTYEIPLDDAEEMAKEYIAAEIKTYIAEEIKSGKSLGEILGVDDSYIEDLIRQEIKGAIEAELKDNAIIGSSDDISEIIGEGAEGIEDLKELSGLDLGQLAELADLADELGDIFSGEVQEKAEEVKEKAGEAKDKVEKKAEEVKEKAEEKKDEKKDEKAEEKKDEKKDEKAEEKADEKEDEKAEEKADEKEDEKAEEKADEKKDEKAEEKADEKKEGSLDDGKPWVDHDLQANNSKDDKVSEKEDFYYHVNQKWLCDKEIKEGRSNESSFSEVSDETLELAKEVFKDDSLKSDDAKMIKAYYGAILDWDARNEAGTEPLEPLFADIQKAETIEDINKLYLDNELRIFVPKFINYGNGAALNDSSKYIVNIVNGSVMLGDPAEYEKRTELGDRAYEAYKLETVKMLGRFGYKEDQAEEIFERALEFEGKLARNMYTSEEKMQSDYMEKINNEMDAKELGSICRNYPLFDMLESEGYGKASKYLVESPDFVKAFDKLYIDGNVENIKAYLLCHLCSTATEVLDREAYELGVEAQNIVTGSEGIAPDEEYAFNKVREELTTPMDKAFLEKYDAKKMKENITGICKEAIDYYREMLKKEDWLSAQTKKEAIKKLDNMTINAVYPDKWKDYSGLDLEGLSYFDSAKAIFDYERKLDAENTDKKVDDKIWDFDILEPNAYYYALNNSINIIRGCLGGAIYSDDMTREELLGGIGAVIGHEISHAFDTVGAQFDENGDFKNWWTDEDYEAFSERAQKLADYYSTITAFKGEKVRGDNIKTEAIADMAGMKCMLGLAAKEKDFDYGKFFEANATVWRRVISEEREYYLLTQDTHPLHFLRSNVTYPQFDEFIEAFGIEEADTMYIAPEDRVLVW